MKALITAVFPCALGFWLFMAMAISLGAQVEAENLARFLPGEIDGWKTASDDRYAGDEIFGYIDGAGEVYRAYNYRSLLARRYAKPGEPDIVVDLFDMASAADAFGVFTHGLEGERLEIGQDAVSMEGLVSFWKDRYFISLYAESETPGVRGALLDLGRAIAGSIPGEGKKPAILGLFPDRFDARSARYFHSHLILNYHYFIASEDILRLDGTAEAALAPAAEGRPKAHLLIVRYPSASAADGAAESFAKSYLHGDARSGPAETKDGRWTAGSTRGAYLVIVLGAPSRDEAVIILGEAAGGLAGRASRSPDGNREPK
jgi:hypothetical protein